MSPSLGVGWEEQASYPPSSSAHSARVEKLPGRAHSWQGLTGRPAEETNPRHPFLISVKGPESHTRS